MMSQEAAGRFLCYLRGRPQAEARIMGGSAAPNIRGTVRFYQTPLGVLTAAAIRGLPEDKQPCRGRFFALHIHEGKSCGGTPDFADAGGHYNQGGCMHPFHAGDLPPLLGSHGFAWSAVLSARFTVQEIIGKTVIIHAGVDDFTSQPAGNAGERIACGVIRAIGREEPWPDPCGSSLLPPDEEKPEPDPLWEPFGKEEELIPPRMQRPDAGAEIGQQAPDDTPEISTPQNIPQEEQEPSLLQQAEMPVPDPSDDREPPGLPPFFFRMDGQDASRQLPTEPDGDTRRPPAQQGIRSGDDRARTDEEPMPQAPVKQEDPPPLLSPGEQPERSRQGQDSASPSQNVIEDGFSDTLFPRVHSSDRDRIRQRDSLAVQPPSGEELASGEDYLGSAESTLNE